MEKACVAVRTFHTWKAVSLVRKNLEGYSTNRPGCSFGQSMTKFAQASMAFKTVQFAEFYIHRFICLHAPDNQHEKHLREDRECVCEHSTRAKRLSRFS